MIYIVRSGDSLSGIAAEHGFADWHTIYDDPNNAEFRQLRPDPNLIFPGDRLFIPDKGNKSASAPTGGEARFRASRADNSNDPEPIQAIEVTQTVVAGKSVRFTISKDSRPSGKQAIANWQIEIREGSEVIDTVDCKDVDRFAVDADGMTIKSVPGQWSHRTLKVRAYAVHSEQAAQVEAPVTFESIVFSDSWTEPASQRHEPGVGDDMEFKDFTEDEYRDIGTKFKEDFIKPNGLLHKYKYDDKSDDQLFKVFQDMAVDGAFSFTHGELEANTRAMIAKFRRNEGGKYTNDALTKAARAHASTQRFVTKVSEVLKEMLKDLQGDAGKLTLFKGKIFSPVYNTITDKLSGLTIAVNDTWAYTVELLDYEFTKPSRYHAKVNFVIFDHFGLNQADVDGSTGKTWIMDPGNWEGFRAWFFLQHVRGYRPFVTKIQFVQEFEDSF